MAVEWVQIDTVRSPACISAIKYYGKREEALVFPCQRKHPSLPGQGPAFRPWPSPGIESPGSRLGIPRSCRRPPPQAPVCARRPDLPWLQAAAAAPVDETSQQFSMRFICRHCSDLLMIHSKRAFLSFGCIGRMTTSIQHVGRWFMKTTNRISAMILIYGSPWSGTYLMRSILNVLNNPTITGFFLATKPIYKCAGVIRKLHDKSSSGQNMCVALCYTNETTTRVYLHPLAVNVPLHKLL